MRIVVRISFDSPERLSAIILTGTRMDLCYDAPFFVKIQGSSPDDLVEREVFFDEPLSSPRVCIDATVASVEISVPVFTEAINGEVGLGDIWEMTGCVDSGFLGVCWLFLVQDGPG